MQEQVRAIPEGFHTVTPHLVCAGAADAMEFYKKASAPSKSAACPAPAARSCTPKCASATRASCWPTNSPTTAATARWP
jgi:hypothetical protein